MKRVFICGDDTYPLHHPVDEIRKELYAVLDKPPLAVTADTEHFEGMDAEDLAQCDLVVMYSDHWPDKIRTSHQLERAFVHYIALGGNLLVLHMPDMMDTPEFAQLVGCRRQPDSGRPVTTQLLFLPAVGHPVSERLEPFSLQEQQLCLEYCPMTERNDFLLAQTPAGNQFPVGWTSGFGMGKTAYLMLGHGKQSFANPSFQLLLRQLMLYLTDVEETR